MLICQLLRRLRTSGTVRTNRTIYRNMAPNGRRILLKKESTAKLSSGFKMPYMGLGMWQTDKADEVEKAIETAIEAGYRHFDTAFAYENEHLIGKTLQKIFESGRVKREDLFIVTKLPPNGMAPESVKYFCQKSLKDLKLDYADLYLIHFPIATKRTEDDSNLYPVENGQLALDTNFNLLDTWKAMEKLVDEKLVKSIGISNFNSEQVQRIYNASRIKPAVLQVECHAYLPQIDLVNLCKKLGIVVTAYSPWELLDSPISSSHDNLLPVPCPSQKFVELSRGTVLKRVVELKDESRFFPLDKDKRNYPLDILLKDPEVMALSERYSATPAQILLTYLLDREIVVIPKSSNPERIKENIKCFETDLSKEDFLRLLSLSKNYRYFLFNQHENMPKHPEYPF
ncbi:aldo-keto reductase family 1 member B1 [Caerostris extrusa]|uniref:Aldo-keto reductase family 1 member B1 n=1 Tax=Caerostris extrusa TaxID=172846 RepID=A0AAV4MJG4_CAEEX|nr:aldo-keto reductase family 1 member B1 [Caerostris extrusa]